MNLRASVSRPASFRTYRLKLLTAIMLMVVLLTGAGLYVARRDALANAARELRAQFRGELDALTLARRIRAQHLAQRCRALVDNARIHAALEDDALDLLYISARDELSDLMAGGTVRGAPVRAKFYRFLDASGAVIAPPSQHEAGDMNPAALTLLGLPHLSERAEVGFVPSLLDADGRSGVDEIVTTPIVASDTRRPIAALVVGLAPEATLGAARNGVRRGWWVEGLLDLPGVSEATHEALRARLAHALPGLLDPEQAETIELAGSRYLLLGQALNPGSLYPPAFEIFLFPLAEAEKAQQRLNAQIVGSGALVLLLGMVASHLLAIRLSRPVEKLALDSEDNARARSQAEAALEMTQAELERAARFSANASHQLKTPVAVLRAGLDELLARDDLPPGLRAELSGLVDETTRFTGMIEDLLLLSRMDAGRLNIEFQTVDLVRVVESCLDDFSVLPDPFNLQVSTNFPLEVLVSTEKRHLAHILQNLVENARRYNRAGGRIELEIRTAGQTAVLSIGNTGRSIAPEHQAHLFDRFHRGATTEHLPGHGLGLNLARDLARQLGGELRLAEARSDWTRFEVTFALADPGRSA